MGQGPPRRGRERERRGRERVRRGGEGRKGRAIPQTKILAMALL